MSQRVEAHEELSPLLAGHWGRLMERYEAMPGRRRKNAFAEMLAPLEPQDVAIVASFTAGEILPAADMERLGLTPAVILAALKQVTGRSEDALMDLAALEGGLWEVAPKLLTAPESSGKITLLQVRTWLSELLGYVREPLEMMVFLLETLPPVTTRYLLRVLLGELPIGLEISSVLDAVALAARLESEEVLQCYELTNSIEDAAERAFRGRRALAQVHCRTGRPYRLMPTLPISSVAQLFERNTGPFMAELEIPGVRLEIHRRHATIQLFTRRLKDVTRAFPELTLALERSLAGTDDLILEGQVFLPGASAEASDAAIQLRLSQLPTARGAVLRPEILLSVALFELTRQGREDLMERSAEERRRRLRMLFKPSERILIVEAASIEHSEQADDYVRDARADGAPGVVFKPARSLYTAGTGGAWLRLAFEPDRVDLAVVGATLNSSGTLSRVTLACQSEGGLAVVGESGPVGTDPGLWKTLQARIQPLIMVRKGERLTLRPELVVEVSARAIRKAPRRPSGFSLAGMVVRLLREDKSSLEVDGPARLHLLLETLGESADEVEREVS